MIGSLNLGYQLIHLSLTLYGTGLRLVTSTSGLFVIFEMKFTQHSIVITISYPTHANGIIIYSNFISCTKPEQEKAVAKGVGKKPHSPQGFSIKIRRAAPLNS